MVSLVSELRPDSCVVAEVRASPNHNERKNDMEPDTIVLHYTGTRDVEDKIRQLCTPGSEISAHYVVLQDGYIIQLVPETRRAWHAGVSSWAGDNDLNSRSIGIEIANRGHEHGYPDFPRRQIAAVTTLCRSILTRHDVPADRVLAHSDVAPARNVDPGEKFLGNCSRIPASGSGSNLSPSPRGAQLMYSAKPIRPSRKCRGCLSAMAMA
jgi:N-acetylmuramoyl-L-alanine amidase